jgi:hypothetical protein
MGRYDGTIRSGIQEMTTSLFADAIDTLTIVDGVARIELVSVVQGADGKTSKKEVATLAMSLPGFVRAYQDMEKIINKLIADGVLQRTAPQVTSPLTEIQ